VHRAQPADHLLDLALPRLLDQRLHPRVGVDLHRDGGPRPVPHPVPAQLLDVAAGQQQRLGVATEHLGRVGPASACATTTSGMAVGGAGGVAVVRGHHGT
jgi:hypothetical protein